MCQTACEGIKLALTTAPVLVMLDYSKPFEVLADTHGFGIGAALLQEGRFVAFRKFLCGQFFLSVGSYSAGE